MPEIAVTLHIDPLERCRGQQRLETTDARLADLLAQNGARLILALRIAERGRDIAHKGGIVLANLNLDAHEALPMPAPLGDGSVLFTASSISRNGTGKMGVRQ